MADLRKAVSDEVGKLLDSSRQLAYACASAVFLGLGLIAARLAAAVKPEIIVPLGVVLLVYVGWTVFSAWQFMKLQRDLRESWRRHLYSLLGDADFNSMVSVPIGKAESAVRLSSWIAGTLAMALFVVTVGVSVVDVAVRIQPDKTADERATALPDLQQAVGQSLNQRRALACYASCPTFR